VVTDLLLPDGAGGQVVVEILRLIPAAAVLVLSAARHPARVQEALDAGAHGYVSRMATPVELLQGLRAAAVGELYLEPSLGVALARWSGSGRRDGLGPSGLSSREEQVLRLVALGHTNLEIARLLGVSLRTVENHRTSLVQKLGRKTWAEWVQLANDSGLIQLRP
jgi:two-component system response regulator NreC